MVIGTLEPEKSRVSRPLEDASTVGSMAGVDLEVIDARGADERVVAAGGDQRVQARPANEAVSTRAGNEQVLALAAQERLAAADPVELDGDGSTGRWRRPCPLTRRPAR